MTVVSLPDSLEAQQLEAAIAALEAQRGLLGDAVVDAAVVPLRAKLATLAPAPVAEEPAQVLRQVTMVFMDVVGSTALGEKLDPEEVADVMDGALARGTEIVRAHGGRVLQYAGDNLLAAFGADEMHEDDAERAVQCGLALLELGRAAGAEVLAAYGHAGFDVRVGVHTGNVLLGSAVDAGGAIRGNAVNIAARMEQTAPPGSMRISHETFAQVRGVFEVEPQAPITVKGVAEPVRTYLVKSAKARAFRMSTRGIEGVETRMIGRDAQFQVLKDAFERLIAERKLTAVSVVGEAGLGKSRLIYEFSNWSEDRPETFLIFQGRATPQTPNQPYGLLRDLVAWRWQIAEGEATEAAKAKLEAGLMPLYDPEEAEAHVHLLGFLIGLDYGSSRHIAGIKDDQRQIRNRGFFAAAELFRRMAAQRGMPIVLQLDDLHWADEPSLEFLDYLGRVARDVPILAIGLTRPTLFERRDGWIGPAPHTRIDLSPLDRSVSDRLADELLKKLPEIPAALRALVTGGADGNPFYMEELVKMLIDQGAIEIGETWQLRADRLMATKVPASLTGILQTRLDGLPAAERRALQEASIIGMVFWDEALAALEADAPKALPSLARRELALPREDASLAGMREYAFKHQILHQVTAETVLKRLKRDWHAKAGDWFANLADTRASEFLGVAAEHYREAGLDARACEYFTRAAEQAKARFANDVALDWIGQAVALVERVPAAGRAELQWRLIDARERTYDLQGNRDAQGSDLETMAALAEALGDRIRGADVAWRQALRAAFMGDYEEQARAARHGMALAEVAGDVPWRLQAQRLLANAIGDLGDIEGGLRLAMAGLKEARALGLRSIEMRFLNVLGMLAELQGDLVAARDYYRLGLPIVIETGDRVNEVIVRANIVLSDVALGLFEQARRDGEEVLSTARAIGLRAIEPNLLGFLSEIALHQGEPARAVDYAEQALAVAVETQSLLPEIEALLRLGNAELALGRHDAAARSFTRAVDGTRRVGQRLPDALAGLARVALAGGDPAAALARLGPVLPALAGKGTADGEVDRALIRLTCWRTLAAAGDPRAPTFLKMAYDEVRGTADRITDPALRESFLTGHPTHRAIVEARRENRRAVGHS